ncbi:MAG: cupin domain-containing protein [Planctomycetes bacterium]|nr:cupin domain-containing protein [Planctomycetota bacterium]
MKRFLAVTIILAAAVLSGCAHHTSGKIEVQTLAKSGQSWDGSVLPGYPEAAPEITILRIVIPPKTELPLHQHPVINAGVLLEGQLTVTTDKQETLHLKAGEGLIEVSNKWHLGRNDGDKPAEIIVFYAGTKDEPITIKK